MERCFVQSRKIVATVLDGIKNILSLCTLLTDGNLFIFLIVMIV